MLAERPRERRLQWDACYNARDTGGYPTANGRRIRWGSLLRADNLSRLTPAGRAALVDAHVGTIIDVRSPFELVIDPPPFARTEVNGPPGYIHLELMTDDVVQKSQDAASVTDVYRLIIEGCRNQVAAIIIAIARAAEGGVLIHCHSGKDRTGLIVALLLALAGVPNDTVAADYALSDTYLQPLHEQLLSESSHDAAEQEQLARALASKPEAMLALLSHIETRYGGVEEYLLGCGVPAEDLERIRERLTE